MQVIAGLDRFGANELIQPAQAGFVCVDAVSTANASKTHNTKTKKVVEEVARIIGAISRDVRVIILIDNPHNQLGKSYVSRS
ncbi:hypothetical protein C7B64_02235 [Merismopedia glauca CCAP 1448/3]|uniref:Uncharacterized protein n=1 Tax=Merismopedia glauca CCAP 1448/3 TaxID=1296344 RepID=A0A2T1C9H2_9CYAN|nr:hypothetical protein C7B64_02235 [Merismopedia glauca CCAP 1448/3]